MSTSSDRTHHLAESSAFATHRETSTQRRNPPPRIYAQSVPIGDPQFIPGAREILVRYKRMIETGEPPEPYDVPLELAATLEAGLRSHETRQRVHLREVMK